MLAAFLVITGISILLGLLLSISAIKFKVIDKPVVEKINNLLPQTQCAQCLYPGCHPYAVAIANGEADINLCPPGGESTIQALAKLLDRDIKPLAIKNETESDNTVAFIDENTCIGCTLCINACPVDAIVGTAKLMHTVISESCTGCELCIPPCPVDCIEMLAEPLNINTWRPPYPVTKIPVNVNPQS